MTMETIENSLLQASSMDFSELTFAYLKPVSTKQGQGFAVCNASGEELAVFQTRDAAYFAAKQHNLEPVLLN
ncbi:MAG: DUF1150 family protein [Alphaproteobacteria bacterium]|nr:DUF1150 family protein [Alphaproteobacteria bacterium]